MTVATTTREVVLETNGATTVFPFNFKVLDESHLTVERRVTSTGVVDKTYTSSEYTLTGVGEDAGSVEITPALAAGYEIIITRTVPYKQDLDIVNQGGFYPESVEAQLDRIVMQIQQIAAIVGRSLVVAPGDSLEELGSATARANRFIAFDSDGQPLLSSGTGADAGLRTDLAAAGGGSMIGMARGGILEDYILGVTPEAFGAVGDGIADDTEAFRDAVEWCKDNQGILHGKPGARYGISDTIWCGTTDNSSRIRAMIGNGATLVPLPGLANKAVFDLTGISNDARFRFEDWRLFDSAGSVVMASLCTMARPKRSSGVWSSGNFIFRNNSIFGWFSAGLLRNVQSESIVVDESNTLFNYHPIGLNVCFTRSDHLKDTFFLEFDNYNYPSVAATALVPGTWYVITSLGTTDFTLYGAEKNVVGTRFKATAAGAGTGTAGRSFQPGELLTGPTGTARVAFLVMDYGGNEGGCLVRIASGTFADNQAISGGTSGATANVDMPQGVTVNPPVSTNPTPIGGEHVEIGSTASLIDIRHSGNAASARAGMPCVFISDYTDVQVADTNLNTNNPSNMLVHVQQDCLYNPGNSQSPAGFRTRNNYYHAVHLWSVTFGDPCGVGANSLTNCIFGPELSTGSPTQNAGRYAYIGADTIYNTEGLKFISDRMLDLRGVRLAEGATIELTNILYSGVRINQEFEGELLATSPMAPRIFIETAVNLSKYTIEWRDMASVTRPSGLLTRVIASGRITADRPTVRVDTEGAAAADDLTNIDLPAGVPCQGMRRVLFPATNTRVPTVVVSANILGPANVVLDNTTKSVEVEGVSGSGSACVWRLISKAV